MNKKTRIISLIKSILFINKHPNSVLKNEENKDKENKD